MGALRPLALLLVAVPSSPTSTPAGLLGLWPVPRGRVPSFVGVSAYASPSRAPRPAAVPSAPPRVPCCRAVRGSVGCVSVPLARCRSSSLRSVPARHAPRAWARPLSSPPPRRPSAAGPPPCSVPCFGVPPARASRFPLPRPPRGACPAVALFPLLGLGRACSAGTPLPRRCFRWARRLPRLMCLSPRPAWVPARLSREWVLSATLGSGL